MKNNVLFATAIMFMACGMVFATTPGALPGSTVDADPTGQVSTANPAHKLPGVVGTEQTPTVGTSSNGERPGTGIETGLKGSASQNTTLLPGIDVVQS
jgi:hypothetical protein